MDTPFQWTKQVASHWGGTRNGTIVHWPAGITEKGGLRSQFTHVIDIAPTILEAAGLPEPIAVNGVQQAPIEGTSMLLHVRRRRRRPSATTSSTSRCSATAASTTSGWSAVTKHKTPWLMVGRTPSRPSTTMAGSSTTASPTTARLATSRRTMPERARLAPAAVAHRGDAIQRAADRRPQRRTARPGARRPADPDPRQVAGVLPRHGAPVGEQRRQHQEQVVLGHRRDRRAGRRRGRRDHRPGRPVRRLGPVREGRQGQVRLQRARHPRIRRPKPTRRSRPGKHQVRMEFAYDGGGLAKGGNVTLYYDGKPVGHGPRRSSPSR